MLNDGRLSGFVVRGPDNERLLELRGLKEAILDQMRWRADSPVCMTPARRWGETEAAMVGALNCNLERHVQASGLQESEALRVLIEQTVGEALAFAVALLSDGE